MRLFYFAWVRTKVGCGEEEVALPDTVGTVAELMDWLAGRSPGHAEAFTNRMLIRAAVDQEHVPLDHPIRGATEVAFFPPVTGG